MTIIHILTWVTFVACVVAFVIAYRKGETAAAMFALTAAIGCAKVAYLESK